MKKNKLIKTLAIGLMFIICSDKFNNKINIENNLITESFAIKEVFAISSKNNIKYDTSINLNIQNNNIILTGNYPLIGNLGSTWFQLEVNNKIKAEIDKVSSNYSANQKIIEMTYDSIVSENYLSIMMYFKNTNTGEVEIKSVNIDILNNSLVDITKLLGSNAYNYANKIALNEATLQNITYKRVDTNTAFYIKQNNIYIVYGAGELTFAQKGNITFEIITNNINNFNLNTFYSKSNYNVKMTPLREVLEYFGYSVEWLSIQEPIKITKNGNNISSIMLNLNKYITPNNFEKELEFAPELVNGTTYVPISFFSEVLDMLIDVDNTGNIVISEYKI